MKTTYFLLVLVFLFSLTFAQSSMVVYKNNFAVISFTKEVSLKKGVNFVSLDEIPQNIASDSFFILPLKEARIVEILYPPKGVMIESSEDMKEELVIFYVQPSINWAAQHMVFIDGEKVRFNTNINIRNSSGMSFQGAKISVLAGGVNVGNELPLMSKAVMAEQAFSLAMPVPESVEGYKIYNLPGEWNISQGSVTIVPLLDAWVKNAEKKYIYDVDSGSKNAIIKWIIANTKENGLGIPLPQGSLKMFTLNDGKVVFIGESYISDIPENEKIEVVQGKDFDLLGESKILDRKVEKIKDYTYETVTAQITLTNRKNEDVTIEVLDHIYGDFQILSSTHPYEKIDENTIRFIVKVSKDSTYTITYSYKVKK
ncbi:MAG: hypothetical protein WBH76_00165 [Dictyoglomaceae bacterium]|nr:hypothetical protein [Dictyoglomaceae bacterium]